MATSNELTTAKIKSLVCPEDKKSIDITDGKVPGLQLRVYRNSKRFVLNYRMAGKRRKLTIGEFPYISLSEARTIGFTHLVEISKGIDPFIEKEEIVKETKAKQVTVSDIIPEFIQFHVSTLRPATQKNYRIRLNNYIKKQLGKKAIDSIDKKEIIRFVEYISTIKEYPAEALHSYAVLSSLLTFAYDRDYIQYKPSLPRSFKKRLKEKVPPRKTIYDKAQIKKQWLYFESIESYSRQSYLKCLYYLGLRRHELACLEWSFYDKERKLLIIPSELTKAKREHVIPLAPQVISLFDELEEVSMRKKYIFSDEIKNDRIRTNSIIRNARLSIEGFAPHDVRRTVRTFWAEIGISKDIAERMLNHSQDSLIQTYDRYSYLKEKEEAYSKWADYLESNIIANKSNLSN